MDIFNARLVDRDYIEDLEKKLRETEQERDRYISKAAELEVRLREISKLEETIPEGCEKGPWCKACEFVRTFHYTRGLSLPGYPKISNVIYTCSKGESCKNFVQKEIEDD